MADAWKELLSAAGVFILFVSALALLAAFWESRNRKKIAMAQALELEEGFTLLECVRAYLGQDGRWEASGNVVYLSRLLPRCRYTTAPLLNIDLRKRCLVVPVVGEDEKSYWPGDVNADNFFDVMIQAAKDQREAASREQ